MLLDDKEFSRVKDTCVCDLGLEGRPGCEVASLP